MKFLNIFFLILSLVKAKDKEEKEDNKLQADKDESEEADTKDNGKEEDKKK